MIISEVSVDTGSDLIRDLYVLIIYSVNAVKDSCMLNSLNRLYYN